jgi:fucose permease
MKFLKVKTSIVINYFLFGILLNSVGTVILQTQRYYQISASKVSILEACKDLSIAAVSFIVASFITKLGYKRAMQLGLFLVTAICFVVPSLKSYLAIKLLFVVTGASFALVKISVFGTIGLITANEKEHLSLMNFIESFFMVGILSGYFLFSYFIDDQDASSERWFKFYYLIGALYALALLLLSTSKIDESAAKVDDENLGKSLLQMLALLTYPFIISFILCAFIYVLVEQSIMSWLPTFNNQVLHLPSTYSVLMASVLAAATALGRFSAGIALKKAAWLPSLIVCLAAASALVLVAMPWAKTVSPSAIVSWKDIPMVAYIFPLIGFFLAPIYPVINSLVLAALPKSRHGAMSGLIVVFSALGGTLGSIITGNIFERYGGTTAFYFSLVPIVALCLALFLFKKFRSVNLINK